MGVIFVVALNGVFNVRYVQTRLGQEFCVRECPNLHPLMMSSKLPNERMIILETSKWNSQRPKYQRKSF